MSEYDVYLNAKGYMLAKDRDGGLVSGAAREMIVDPFTRHLSTDEPYTRVPFRFGDGAGLTEYDSSSRYEWGNCVDSRSGRLIPAPERAETAGPYYELAVTDGNTANDVVVDDTVYGDEGVAERFITPTPETKIRSLAVLVKRHSEKDYSSAANFTVEIWSDTAGPKPNAQLASVSVSIKRESDPHSPFVDRWRNGQFFWLEVVFAADVVIGASTAFWVAIINDQTPSLYLADGHEGSPGATRSLWDGAAWSNGATDWPLFIKIGYRDGASYQFDSFPRCFQVYAGTDLTERMYCGTGYRIQVRDSALWGADWSESKEVGTPVTQLLEFNEKLFAACGDTTDIWYSTGASATTVWAQITGQQATAFAIHDNMLWKADLHVVNGSVDGTTWTGTAVNVGDPGTPVTSMVSHGGKLFCAKPEGVYEISYPDTYPATGTPTCNLMLDFTTERSPRTWLLDWHSGLYFPGLGGVYELKFDVLRNLWADKVDENALEASGESGAPYTRPRSWSPLYDEGPVSWAAAHGTTRGAAFARSNPHLGTSDVIWFDGNNWYSLRAVGDTTTEGAPESYGEYCTAVFVQDAGGGRGWLWYNEGYNISRTEWPTWTEDTVDDGTVEYERYSQITTPWFSLGEQTKQFLLCKIGAVTKNLTATIHIDVSYRVDDNTSWTVLGILNDSPYLELSFPAATTARRVQFKLMMDIGATGSTTAPIIEQLDLFYQTLPEPTKTHQLIISCVGDHSLREAGVDERTAGEILADLRALVGNTGFTYLDPLGGSHTVRITALTGQTMDLLTGPGPESVGASAQVILNLLEV